jgi:hypothetical protein
MTKNVNEHRAESLSRTLFGRTRHCPVEPYIVRPRVSGAQNWRLDLCWTLSGGAEHCPVGVFGKRDFLPKSAPSFPSLILDLYFSKSNETWTHRSPQHKEQVLERGSFPNLMISLLILDELKNLGFEGRRRNP